MWAKNFTVNLKFILFLLSLLNLIYVIQSQDYVKLPVAKCNRGKYVYCFAKAGDDWKSKTNDLNRQLCCFYFTMLNCMVEATRSQCQDSDKDNYLNDVEKSKETLNGMLMCSAHKDGSDCTNVLAWWAITLIVIAVLVVIVGLVLGGYYYIKKNRIHVCCF